MVRVVGVLALVLFVAWLFALVDAGVSEPMAVRGLPKVVWLVLIALTGPVGTLLWFGLGRPRGGVPTNRPRRPRTRGPEGPPPSRRAPDDDPEFLRRLDREARQAREASRRREQRREGGHPEPGAPGAGTPAP